MLGYMVPSPDAIVFKNGQYISFWNTAPMPSGGTEIINPVAFDALNSLRTALPVVIYGICIMLATYLFYRHRMKKPLEMLNRGIERISRQELDFALESPCGDELGRLCRAFEKMRGQLADTFQALWISEENQRSMNRAVAHDLRTPLTIIKGNNEIIQFVAAKNDNWQEAISAAASSDHAIARIERYADQLKTLDSIDQLTLDRQLVELRQFAEEYGQQARILAGVYGKDLTIACGATAEVCLDGDVLARVLDNLLANALEHAAQSVWMEFVYRPGAVEIAITDDGAGFCGEALTLAARAFYTTDKTRHSGVGLTICEKLLGRMGTTLQLSNRDCGGAGVRFFLPV